MPKITGRKATVARIRALAGPDMVKEVGSALYAAGNLIEVDAALSITNGSVSGKNHVPSAPGEPPNADTHVLDRSITTTRVEPLKVEVSADAPYAAHLEFGTSRMAPRPYMAPAVARKRKEVTELIRRAVKRAVDKNGGVRGA